MGRKTPGRDYRYRASVSRDALAEGLAALAHALAYANFKSEVGSRDPDRAHVYGRVWSDLGSIQRGGPYSTFLEADHAFFNDTGARFNVQAAEEAWRRVVDWFDDAGDDHHHHHR